MEIRKLVNVVIGPGSIGQAIARRVSAGKHIVLADINAASAEAAAKILSDAGFDAELLRRIGLANLRRSDRNVAGPFPPRIDRAIFEL